MPVEAIALNGLHGLRAAVKFFVGELSFLCHGWFLLKTRL
jgi:hypothetical protein